MSPSPIGFWLDEDCPDEVAPFTCEAAAERAFDRWNDEPCSRLAFELLGTTEVSTTFDGTDRVHTIAFDDPDEDLEPGVLAATLVQRWGDCGVVDGIALTCPDDADIAFNDGVNWTTDAHVEAGLCQPGQTGMERLLIHELGHVAGIGHSCDEGDPCQDQALRDVVMHWTSMPGCRVTPTIGEDDRAALRWLYGPRFDVACNPPGSDGVVLGAAPMTVWCPLTSEAAADLDAAGWEFGDGAVGDGLSVTPTYAAPGRYRISATLAGASDDCPAEDWGHAVEAPATVTVCGIPDPAFHVENVDRLTYAVRNDTPLEPYGCVTDCRCGTAAGRWSKGAAVTAGSRSCGSPTLETSRWWSM